MGKNFLKFIEQSKSSNITFFTNKKKYTKSSLNKEFRNTLINNYTFDKKNDSNAITEFSEVGRNCGDISFLEGKSSRVLLMKYPYRARYVCVKISLNPSFLLSLPGLLRRLFIGVKRLNSRIDIIHVGKLPLLKSSSYWIVIQNTNAMVPTQFSLSEEIGIKGFLDFLNKEIKDYVVVRFFEKLPELNRPDGDLDIMVKDHVWEKTKSYLLQNPGKLMIDMYGESTPASGSMLPYYPTHLANSILNESVEGPGNSKVPNVINYLHSFIYHCIYHKGYTSGLSSRFFKNKQVHLADNDYEGHIKRIAKLADVEITDLTMEGLDEYMKTVGWRPHIDTLMFIALTNSWLKKHLESINLEKEIGLSVIIIKNKGIIENKSQLIKEHIIKNNYKLLFEKTFTDSEVEKYSKILRGGNWTMGVNGDKNFLPRKILIIQDVTDYTKFLNIFNIKYNSIRTLKTKLRKQFDNTEESIIHATDNSAQAIEYMEEINLDSKFVKEIKKKKTPFEQGFYFYFKVPFYFIKFLFITIKSTFIKGVYGIVNLLLR